MFHAPLEQQIYVAFLVSGVVAGAVPLLAAVPAAFVIFCVPPVTVVMVETAIQGDSPLLRMVSIMSVLFLFTMIRSSRSFADAMDDSIRKGLAQHRLARELERSRDAAQQASLAKSRFLATMSHELRTPMNGVLGMSQILLEPGLTSAERDECVRTIHSSGHVLLAQLNDILDLTRIEAGRLPISHADFDPAQVCREVIAIFQAQARGKGIDLRGEWTGDAGARYRSDPIRLRQMLMNLVNNAVKFTKAGEVDVVARCWTDAWNGAWLEFAVRDTGIGIAADDQAMLFQPFSQVDNSDTRSFGGTGLGLSIVRQLAELLGGGVGLQSEPGRGSRFWFRVPAIAALAPPATVEQPPEAAAPPEPEHGPASDPPEAPRERFVAHVLIVEDVAVNRKVVQGMLRKLGCTSHWVEDGIEAVEEFLRRPQDYDLVLMDCQMPRMDGYEATARIRAWELQQGRARIGIVAISAAAYQDDIRRCHASGMDDFLPKPIAIEELGKALQRWLPAEVASDEAAQPG
jgi:signal transduction histidine kinase